MSSRRSYERDSSGDSEPPISVSPEKKVSLPMMMIVGLIGATISATIGWTALQADVKAATLTANAAHSTAKQHEERLRALEDSRIRMLETLDWIKRRMEEDRRGRP